MPQVAAIGAKKVVCSETEKDLQNSIFLIADGKAPTLTGTELLKELDVIEYTDGEVLEVDITATDNGSGLDVFYVEVRNNENGTVKRFEDTAGTGKIHLVISDEDTLYLGEFEIAVYAADCVGNETIQNNDLLGVGLKAYVERVLAPHTPQFKRGESGVLYVETTGYIEKLEISFPKAFVQADETLSRSIVYEVPDYRRTEEIPFIVPFSVSDGEMIIQIRAYKAGTELDAEPKLVTIKVKGSILDELRTRLR